MLNFETKSNDDALMQLYQELPQGVRMELMMVINKETFRKFPILKTCGNKYY